MFDIGLKVRRLPAAGNLILVKVRAGKYSKNQVDGVYLLFQFRDVP
jgi:hypothetical protein